MPTAFQDRPWLVAWLCFVPVVLLRAGTIAEGDTFWQVRTGVDTLARSGLIYSDELSWTAGGRPWIQNSWLFNVLDGLAYRTGGLPAVALMGAAAGLGVAAVVLRIARQVEATPLAATAALMVYLPLLIVAFNVRPQLVDYLAFGIVLLLLRGMWTGQRLPQGVAALAGISIAWANLHPATPTVIVLCAVLMATAAVRRRLRVARALATSTIVVAVATGLNPYGYRIIQQGLVIAQEARGYVFEWRHADPRDVWQVAFVALALVAAREYHRRREAVLLIATAVTVAFYLVAVRYLPWVIIAATPGLALLGSRPPVASFLQRRQPVLVAGVLTLLAVALPSLGHLGRPDPGQFATTVVAALPRDCRLYNVDTTGGIVSLLRPDVLVAADGRVEVYGARELYRIRRSLDMPAVATDLLNRATCAIVPPGSALAVELAESDQWRHIMTDGPMALYARTG